MSLPFQLMFACIFTGSVYFLVRSLCPAPTPSHSGNGPRHFLQGLRGRFWRIHRFQAAHEAAQKVMKSAVWRLMCCKDGS